MKTKNIKIISVQDWDDLVSKTYGKIYSFQQQDNCKDRGIEYFSVPTEEPEDYKNDTISEIVNSSEMGVSFKAWLKRDPKKPIPKEGEYDNEHLMLELFWDRNFYPHLEVLANDLYNKGLLEAGNYAIEIDW